MTERMKLPPGVLRKCVDCGREVRKESDLESFMKKKKAPHGRANLCKACRNDRTRLKRRTEYV